MVLLCHLELFNKFVNCLFFTLVIYLFIMLYTQIYLLLLLGLCNVSNKCYHSNTGIAKSIKSRKRYTYYETMQIIIKANHYNRHISHVLTRSCYHTAKYLFEQS